VIIGLSLMGGIVKTRQKDPATWEPAVRLIAVDAVNAPNRHEDSAACAR
jgi:hypothetical protein